MWVNIKVRANTRRCAFLFIYSYFFIINFYCDAREEILEKRGVDTGEEMGNGRKGFAEAITIADELTHPSPQYWAQYMGRDPL